MYALVELHDANYQPLADITWEQNKLKYAELHGYKTFCKTDNFVPTSIMGYQKIHYVSDLMKQYPEIEWFWITGTDTLITNFATRIEDRIISSHHFIICADNNGLNADSLLVRNSPEGRAYIHQILALEPECSKFWDGEQRAIQISLGFPVTCDPAWRALEKVEVAPQYTDIVKIMPQRYMNSFNYKIYGDTYTDHRDTLWQDGNWQFGDWLIHWPGTTLPDRIELAKLYIQHVIK